MSEFALNRLIEERAQWRRDPMYGFAARPAKSRNGSLNYMVWDCIVPGEAGTAWKQARYNVRLIFDIHYPASLPQVFFEYPIIHPNVDESGYMTLPHFDPNSASSSISIKKILWTVQCQMDRPNMSDLSNEEAQYWLSVNADVYYHNVQAQSLRMAEEDHSLPNYKPKRKKNKKRKSDAKSKRVHKKR